MFNLSFSFASFRKWKCVWMASLISFVIISLLKKVKNPSFYQVSEKRGRKRAKKGGPEGGDEEVIISNHVSFHCFLEWFSFFSRCGVNYSFAKYFLKSKELFRYL